MGETFFSRQLGRATQVLNRAVPWYRLPPWLGLANLAELRNSLRAHNLHDTSRIALSAAAEAEGKSAGGQGNDQEGRALPLMPPDAEVLKARTPDGSYNDLENPRMGMAGARFGRNLPLDKVVEEGAAELLAPSPRLVSERLLARKEFLPATSLNVLAAAWIQFMTRDWFSHGQNETQDPHQIPLAPDDGWHERPMQIQRTRKDPTRCPFTQAAPTFLNAATHWWDASQIYGSDASTVKAVRGSGDGSSSDAGKLKLEKGKFLPLDPRTQLDRVGFLADTTWTGVGLLHTLFALEHNAICDALKTTYPRWSGDEIFARARMVNAALIAKIHTVEWTPALLSHPTTTMAMNANWWGLASERVNRLYGRVSDDEILSGIPGSAKNHHGVPYAITEEFVSVYRMHSLIPDEVTFRALRNNVVVKTFPLSELLNTSVSAQIDKWKLGVDDLLYSFGLAHPGALRLHNYPNTLRRLDRADKTVVDLAAVDILRDRERAVPRYNDFRRMLGLPAPSSFDKLTDNSEWAQELAEVYEDVERVDLQVGLLAEPLPDGMAFSDTAFRVFILMASRRLKSDRFFTTDFTERVYSKVGMDWVQENTMSSVLIRHFPSLTPALAHAKNAFSPWNSVAI